ncbi:MULTISPECIES: hypothetical protein [unclassified Brevundimonas]|uniref:hypothetical protein n=1 Tax=unclassified Brevundimonas TaxID=2622653 RepID=UPI003B589E7A
MREETQFSFLDGAEAFSRWFGIDAPYFHDAEVESLTLTHRGESRLSIRTFRMTPEVDAAGYFVLEKHCLLTFILQDVFEVDLDAFDEGAILMGLTVLRHEQGMTLDLDPVIGVGGRISARGCRVEYLPRETVA